jgi:hypothetical protein
VVVARLRRREAQGSDPSDAGPEQYQASVAAFEPIREPTTTTHVALDTDRGDWRRELTDGLRHLLASSARCIPPDGIHPERDT